MSDLDKNKIDEHCPFFVIGFIYLVLFMHHAMMISAYETTISLSEMGFNSIRWFILVLLGFCLCVATPPSGELQGALAQTRRKYAATTVPVPDGKENKRKSTWFGSVVQVLSYAATCAFLLWGLVTLYRFGTDPIKRVVYYVMVTYPAPFLWCMGRLCSIEKEDVKTQKRLQIALRRSLVFMISNDTFCYAVLGAGKTILGAAILGISQFILIEWACFFQTTNLAGDEKLENNTDRCIGNILTYAAICVLTLWSVICLHLQSDNLFLCAVCCITLLSPIPFILCVKAFSYVIPEKRRLVTAFVMTYSLAFMCFCIAFCLTIVSNINSDLKQTITLAVLFAMLAFLAGFVGGGFVLAVQRFQSKVEFAMNNKNDKMARCNQMLAAPSRPKINSKLKEALPSLLPGWIPCNDS